MKTLVDLVKGNPSSEEILNVFKDYGKSGAAISSHSIALILNKTELSPYELGAAYNYMKKGYELHKKLAQHKKSEKTEATEFLKAMNLIADTFKVYKHLNTEGPAVVADLVGYSIEKKQDEIKAELGLESLAERVLEKIPAKLWKFRNERFCNVGEMKELLSNLVEKCGDKQAFASDRLMPPADYGFKSCNDAYQKMLLLKKAWKGIIDVELDKSEGYLEVRYRLAKK